MEKGKTAYHEKGKRGTVIREEFAKDREGQFSDQNKARQGDGMGGSATNIAHSISGGKAVMD